MAYTYHMRARTLAAAESAVTEPPPAAELRCELVSAAARDGAALPVTLAWRADAPLSSESHLHVLAYGAYGTPLPASWRPELLPLELLSLTPVCPVVWVISVMWLVVTASLAIGPSSVCACVRACVL